MTIYALATDLSHCSDGFLSPKGRVCVEIDAKVVNLQGLVDKIAEESRDFTKVVHCAQELELLEKAIRRIDALYKKALNRGCLHPLSHYGRFTERFIYKDLKVFESVKKRFSAFTESMSTWSLIAREAYKIHGEPLLANSVIKRVCVAAEKETKTGVVSGVYGLTNESFTLTTLYRLKVNGGVHAGFSGWFNFDIMAKKKSSYAVLCDFNVNVQHFMRASLHYLRKCKTRHEFAGNMIEYAIDQDKKIKFVDPAIYVDGEGRKYIKMASAINLELEKHSGWLGSDAAYAHVKRMAEEGRVAVITANAQDSELFTAIRKIFDEQGEQITSLYVTNILPYCNGREERKGFYTTIEKLSCPETELIASAGLQQYTGKFGELKGSVSELFEAPHYRKFFTR